ncbi:ParB N-terminal domain-containing protein [Fundidesulfovibrio terrae]|uniref:ParB N-terminal domain-containing protein n=1 Tax=Fundidesulfovibrio terrae TaxID=2922866 RepID=UPI001FB03A33|nr:ParB N-terminal domain-containing protein [Fundidesulfovibrio terrae]
MKSGQVSDFTEDTITLRKREIKVRTGFLPHHALLFYAENPRIYSIVWKEDGDQPTQEEIFEALAKTAHVRETLVPSIRSNGGLIEPIMVRKNVVLEGNSRLAAYRLLAQKDANAWELIRVRILPDTISDSEVFSLLGEFHIVGKKDWSPFEQAGYLYRRFKTHGIDEKQLQREVGLTTAKIRHLIHVYDFMLNANDRNPERWSYYDELLKGRRFNQARDLYTNFDHKITEMIQSEEIERAVDIRDGLPKIVKIGGNTLKKFMNDKLSFHDAVHEAHHRGAGNYYIKKLKDIKSFLAEDNLDEELARVSGEERSNLSYLIQRIAARVNQIAKKINGNSH